MRQNQKPLNWRETWACSNMCAQYEQSICTLRHICHIPFFSPPPLALFHRVYTACVVSGQNHEAITRFVFHPFFLPCIEQGGGHALIIVVCFQNSQTKLRHQIAIPPPTKSVLALVKKDITRKKRNGIENLFTLAKLVAAFWSDPDIFAISRIWSL